VEPLRSNNDNNDNDNDNNDYTDYTDYSEYTEYTEYINNVSVCTEGPWCDPTLNPGNLSKEEYLATLIICLVVGMLICFAFYKFLPL
jgi:hypothetical protein